MMLVGLYSLDAGFVLLRTSGLGVGNLVLDFSCADDLMVLFCGGHPRSGGGGGGGGVG
ncbi:hypothetical protein QJS10_CPA06g01590 [Acorus calamus]|uniref:Uncharacterized protein n=1 Tax=Acorus calamus TaxID=4465 RepID=A0AAV9EPF5_ACOCL|nr:hypothetical protein QJS10_CPA06g01590 [Acorus calamus]